MAHLPLPDPPVLQRDLFSETIHLVALRIPKKECQVYMKLLHGSVSAHTFSDNTTLVEPSQFQLLKQFPMLHMQVHI